ncbi:MAG: aminomethyltransferase family protein [Thermodesulfobacteriota bacterium]
MPALHRTVFNEKHKDLGATMVNFSGWQMPGYYPGGNVREHLAARYQAGLFDDSHKGKFIITGSTALHFLQHVLTGNADALSDGQGLHTIIQNDSGFALDNSLLFRFRRNRYMLCVSTACRERIWDHLHREAENFRDLYIEDKTFDLAMLSLQGPGTGSVINRVVVRAPQEDRESGLPGDTFIAGTPVIPVLAACPALQERLYLFMEKNRALPVWEILTDSGAEPVGLEARETLRLESGMPLFGNEPGADPENSPIPIFACPFARSLVSFSLKKGDFIGKDALVEQFEAYGKIAEQDLSGMSVLPRMIHRVVIKEGKSADRGNKVYRNSSLIGFITSAALVPFRLAPDPLENPDAPPAIEERSMALALLDSATVPGNEVQVKIRNRLTQAVVVPYPAEPGPGFAADPAPWTHLLHFDSQTLS